MYHIVSLSHGRRVSQLVVNCWFGGSGVWIPIGSPLEKVPLLHFGAYPRIPIPKHRAPNQQVSSLLSIPNCFSLTTSHLILCIFEVPQAPCDRMRNTTHACGSIVMMVAPWLRKVRGVSIEDKMGVLGGSSQLVSG